MNAAALITANILIVNDSAFTQGVLPGFIKNTLKELVSDCFFEQALDGQQGIDKAKERKWDVIIMDVMMPVMNGIDSTVGIRKFDKETPIIGYSSRLKEEEMRAKGEAAGMTEMVEDKPQELKKALFKVFEKYAVKADQAKAS